MCMCLSVIQGGPSDDRVISGDELMIPLKILESLSHSGNKVYFHLSGSSHHSENELFFRLWALRHPD